MYAGSYRDGTTNMTIYSFLESNNGLAFTTESKKKKGIIEK